MAGLFAQPQSSTKALARAELERSTVQIGDQVGLTIRLSAPPDTEVAEIDFEVAGLTEAVEIVKATPLQEVAARPELLLEQRLLLQVFDTGYVFIPELPVPVRYPDGRLDTAFTENLMLTITGVATTDDEELMPIKPIIREPLNWLDFWPAYLGLFLLLAGWLAWKIYSGRGRNREEAPPPPPPPAHEIALERLRDLEGKSLWQRGELQAYYTELSHILRVYLEEGFSIPALESTTRQIDRALADKKRLTGEQRSELSQLLQLSDLVKFARAEPADDLHQRGLERIRTFVTTTGTAFLREEADQTEEE